MSAAESSPRACLVISEVRALAPYCIQPKNAQKNAQVVERLQALDARMSTLLERNTKLTQEISKLKEVENRAKIAQTSHKKQMDLVRAENEALRRELEAAKKIRTVPKTQRVVRAGELNEARDVAVRAQGTAMRALKELEAAKRQLISEHQFVVGLLSSPANLPPVRASQPASPIKAFGFPSSPIDIPLLRFPGSPAVALPVLPVRQLSVKLLQKQRVGVESL